MASLTSELLLPPDTADYWNVFAAVLDETLKTQDPELRLGHLDDRPDPETGLTIHRHKVARLQHSLSQPIFPTLTPEEINRVVRAFHLSRDQQIRLHAAVLATAVQAMLAGRIGAEDARLAGWQVLPIIERQLRAHWDEDEGLGAARDPVWMLSATVGAETDDFPVEYAVALIEIDQAMLHLALANRTTALRARRTSAFAAKRAFEVALGVLDAINDGHNPALREACIFWQQEARHGVDVVKRLLASEQGSSV